ncbi:hypothetical protein [Syntrophotalea acetylenica]|uniref:Uncharacterized protein n=1 Tax=Syntrophotalea acetylenica TaxID=29542 RepID=A0A1L3GE25_SYNAC|nr:hypothetical protein [Syntrophotalea acetylenica]APG24075.1 hypothetical protein A7E75_02805 [Syntrophotalea acetylenica]APG44657.1 hypothetical protein A6070_11430 [Syntrophotalea acetylenica]APG45457.1 hypothetical protein A6070_14855 [Syntrophotalea acetylenica]
MIVADFSGQVLVLDSLQDAEALLGIISRGKPVRWDHRLPNDACYVEGATRRCLELTVSPSRVVTEEEAGRLLSVKEAGK